jgi:pentalenolactone synthase
MTDGARSRAGLARLQEYMRALVARKREQPAEDVLSDLIAAQAYAPDRFTDDHVVTLAAIDKGVLLLLTHPDARVALDRDPDLIPRAVEEILRLPSPAEARQAESDGGLPRYANADIEIGGVTIRAGDMVLLDLQSGNLDDRVFPTSEAFEVTREPNPHLTFGHGPHYCIGAPLARIELQALFGTLFRRFPTLRLAVPVEALHSRSHLLTGGLAELPVTW